MISANETFAGTFPFAPHFSTASGFRMHYEGEGELIVCLHGGPTWGYLYRHLISLLSKRYRVIVPDHMGFGKSETPADKVYTLATHVKNLEVLLLELDLWDIALVLHDWCGPIGGGFALRHLDHVKRLFLMNMIVPLGMLIEAGLLAKATTESKWFEWAMQAYHDGILEEVLGNAGVTILHLMKQLQGFENSAAIDQTWGYAYSAHFQTKVDCQGIINFPLDVITGRETQFQLEGADAIAALRQKPAMMAEGMKDFVLPPQHFIPIFEAGFPHASVVQLENAGHFCQEDQPDTLVALIDQFIQLTS